METNFKPRSNGRVDILQQPPSTNTLFSLYDKNNTKQCSSYYGSMTGNWEETLLSRAFFSRENIIINQNAIRRGVYEISNKQHLVGEQDCDSLKIIMRSIFLQNAVNSGNIQSQIIALNDIVIAQCVRKVYNESKGYLKYLSDASTLVVPIDRPVLVNRLDKNLEFKGWF